MHSPRISRGASAFYATLPALRIRNVRIASSSHKPIARSRATRAPGGAYSWTNVVGACERCNGRKADRSLLRFLWVRAR